MRVLVVPKWFPWPDRPVFGIFCREQARAIAREHDVVVLASEAVRRPPFRVFALEDGVEDGLRTLRLRYRRPLLRPAAMGAQLIGMLAALRRLRREGWRPELVHAHVYSAGLPALVLGTLSRAPVVISEHFTGFQRGMITGYDRLTARLAFRGADLVAPVSDDLARYVRELAPETPIRVVANVVDTDVFHPGSRELRGDGAARLLTVATLTEKKGHADLLRALAGLDGTRPLTLDLVGGGELRDELERLAGELSLSDTVRFHGEQPKETVAELMRGADLFVLPSHHENLPCVLIEAMASGLPVVATAVGGVPELLAADGHGALLCPPRDPGALGEAILTALQSRAEYEPGTVVGWARERFGYDAVGRVWTTIYAELVANRAGRTRSRIVRRTASRR